MIGYIIGALLGGFSIGILFSVSRLSKIRKRHAAALLAITETARKKDQKAIEDFKKEYQTHLREYRTELDKLIHEEEMILDEGPDKEWWN